MQRVKGVKIRDTSIGNIQCSLSPQEVSQLEMEMHLEALHEVDTRELDWSRPLRREVRREGEGR